VVAFIEFVVRIVMKTQLNKQALQPAGQRPLSPAAKGDDLLSRAKSFLDQPHTVKAAAAASPSERRGERVKATVTCCARGQNFTAIAERCGDELRFVGHEIPKAGSGGRMPDLLSGRYSRIFENGWACVLCGTKGGVWVCECERMRGALHCLGSVGGRGFCACGRLERREFEPIRSAEVRGVSVGSQTGSSSPKQVTHGNS
jgi:hypothetical protein